MFKDRDAYNAYQREYQKNRARQWKAYAVEKLGGVCAKCGTTDSLEIDHVDWRSKANKYNNLWSIAKEKSEAELEKCQLLCTDHHKEKTVTDKAEQAAAKRNGTYVKDRTI